MKHVMIDFETFSTSTTAVVVQIGAAYFNMGTGEIGDTLSINVAPASGVKAGAKIDADTVMWWMNQSKEAQQSILNEPKLSYHEAFSHLNNFLLDSDYIWSHATFDFVILQETLKMLGIKPSFKYKSGMDIRTLNFLSNRSSEKLVREGIHHNALDDCKFQIKYVTAAFNSLK